jgi:predicted AAA+ superfamily ATPase
MQALEDLVHRAERGAVFESFVVSELHKNFMHRGGQPRLHFWRDAAGHEVDLLIEMGERLIPVEIKSGQTLASDFFDGLDYWRKLSGDERGPAALVYGGEQALKRSGAAVYPWYAL